MTVMLLAFGLAAQLAVVTPAAPAQVDRGAAVEIVVYSDFQCPFCARFAGPFRELQTKGIDGVETRVTFMHFPLSIHPDAQLAHQAALAAKAQEKFWEMHDLLFANQQRAQRADLLGYAQKLGLDLARFEKDLDSESVKSAIAADVAEGTKLGVRATPSYTINGKLYSGARSLAQLKQLIAPAPVTKPASPARVVPAGAIPPVDVVVYSDFQCPFCGQFAGPIRELQSKGIDGVETTVTFKHFPLSIHPNALLAHQAALAAKAQGKFWEMHDLLFANQQHAQRADLVGYAKKLGLDIAQFEKDMDSESVKKAIAEDRAEGSAVGVQGTPSYTINGKLYLGTRPLPQLKQLIAGDQLRLRALAEVTDNSMSRGPTGAPVVLELFADLQSPVSRPTLDIIDQVMRQYPSGVRLQFRNFPLAFHPQAALAHEAAMTAGRQGHFWEFAAFILAHQDALREQDLIAYAGELGLDPAQFAETLQQHRYAPRVEADLQAGQTRGIRGSPVILVNDKRIDGVPSLQTLTEYVDAALTAAAPTPVQRH